MNKTLVIIILGLLVSVGCNRSDKEKNDQDPIIISIGAENHQERINYSQLFDRIRYIILDTNDDCLIGIVGKIVFYENQFYIFDVQQHIVFVFSETGQFLWKLDKRGNGPGEYAYLMDFDIHQNRLYVFDRRRQLLEYDLSGNFITHYTVTIPGTSYLQQNEFSYFYTCNMSSPDFGNYALLIMDKEGKNFQNGIPVTQTNLINKCVNFNNSSVFCRYNNNIRFYMPFETNVYSIAADSIFVPYRIDIKNKNIPANYFERNTYEDLRNTSYAYGMNTFWENDSYISFSMYFDQRGWDVLYTKNEAKPVYGTFFDDIAYCFPSFQHADNDFVIGFRLMNELHGEYAYAQEIKESREGKIIEEIVQRTNEEDNPVLFICYLKK